MSQNHATIKQPGAFSTWYNGNSGQRTVGAFYSLGASVVIIGALFKIMHCRLCSYSRYGNRGYSVLHRCI